ncbi:TPA: hypothetical protein KRH68_000695 [Clostridioides difficile]|nr:hypothetical protein [Clostridioides difficile]
MAVILSMQDMKGNISVLSSNQIANIVGIDKSTISRYKNKLIKNNIFMPSNLSKTITYATFKDIDVLSIKSELIPHKENCKNRVNQDKELDNFRYQVKLVADKNINFKRKDNIIIDNSLYEDYLNACRIIANTPFLKDRENYNRVVNMVKHNKQELNVTQKDKYIAFNEFTREIGLVKLYQVHKTEYRTNVMKNKELLDIIVKAFKYRNNNSNINNKLVKYNSY